MRGPFCHYTIRGEHLEQLSLAFNRTQVQNGSTRTNYTVFKAKQDVINYLALLCFKRFSKIELL